MLLQKLEEKAASLKVKDEEMSDFLGYFCADKS